MSDRDFRRMFRIPGRRGLMARDVDEELEFHVELRTRDLIDEGWSAAEAHAEALRQFGNMHDVRRACRRIGVRREGEMRVRDWFDRVCQDVRFAVRQFASAPLASGLAIVTLAIGIAAATIVFTVVDAVVLDAVPFPAAERLFVIDGLTPTSQISSSSEPDFLDWRANQHSFSDVGAYTAGDRTLVEGGVARRVSGLRVTHSLLSLLGLDPVLGRPIAPAEDVPEGPTDVVVLSEGFFERHFGSDPSAVGGTVPLDGRPFEVIGVVASDHAFPGMDIFTPLAPDADSDRGNHMLQAVARLAPGVTLEAAREDVTRVAADLQARYPETNAGWSAAVRSLREHRVGEGMERTGRFLLGAVALLLLMACGSVSNMLIARSTVRRREMGVRAALGAGRRRIVGQLVTEGAVLGALGSGLGIAVAWVGLPLVRALGPADLDRLAQATIDGRVLTVSVAAALASVLVFGLAPALVASRGRLFDALKDGARSAAAGGRRLRSALVVAQFALAIVVVLGAGLMVRSFDRLRSVDLGYRPEGAIQFAVSLPDGAFDVASRVDFLDRLKSRIEGLPGVESVGLTMTPPFGGLRASNHVAAADHMPERQEDFAPASWRAVDGDYFPAAGIGLLAGRLFGPSDKAPAPIDEEDPEWQPSVVIDSNLAGVLWGTLDVIGKEVVWGDPGGTRMRVVGVVEPTRDEYVDGPPRPRIYLHYDLFPWPDPSLVVRAGGATNLVPAIRGIVAELDPNVPVTGAYAMPEMFRNAIAWPRFTMQVVTAFGLVAILLAAMGVYGVTAFDVARLRRELGIRLALGAEPSQVLRVVLGRGLRLALVGMVVGVGAALALAGFIGQMLYDVDPADPLTFTVVPVGLAAVALLATWLAAQRATKVHPREALAAE